MRPFAAIAVTSLALTQVRNARAETFSVSIVDPVGCVVTQRLVERVTARAQGAAFLASGGRFSFFLRLERNAGMITAELQIANPNNPTSTRVVDGASCEEVASAVALIMALTLDPRRGSADTQFEPTSGAVAPPAPTAQSPTVPDAPRANASQNALVPTAARAPPIEPAAVRSEPYWVAGEFRGPTARKSSHHFPWRIGIGAQLQWTSLFTTNGGMWLLGLRGEGAKTQRLFMAIQASIGPKVVRDDGKGTSAAFSFYGVGAELGTPIVGSHGLATDAMIVASLGALHSASVQQGPITGSRYASATWVGLGPGLRLRWFSNSASLAFQTTVPVNLVRPRFSFISNDGSEQAFYRMPSAGIFFGLCGTWNVEPSNDPIE